MTHKKMDFTSKHSFKHELSIFIHKFTDIYLFGSKVCKYLFPVIIVSIITASNGETVNLIVNK